MKVASLRYAFRRARRQRGLSALLILALALGLGGATAALALAERALVNPFGLPQPEQLMAIADSGTPAGAASYSRLPAFTAACGYTTGGLTVTAGHTRGHQYVAAVTADFFRVAGIAPRTGRRFSAGELQAGNRVAIISHDLAAGGYGGAALGGALTMGGERFAVIGVMPQGFGFPAGTAVWIPAHAAASNLVLMNGPPAAGLGSGHLIARLRPRVNLAEASAEVGRQQRHEAAAWDALHPRGPKMGVSSVTLTPLLHRWTRGARGTVDLLLAAAGLLFLISCFVAGGVLLARALNGQKETAARMALGARRWQLARQWLIEALVLVAPATAVAAGVAAALMAALRRGAPAALPGLDLLHPRWSDGAVLAALAVVALVLTALPPLLSTLRLRSPAHLLQTSFYGGVRASLLWPVVVIFELAVALALTASAALLLASFGRLTHTDLGFAPAGIQTVTFTTAPALAPLLQRRERAAAFARAAAINRTVLTAAQRIPGATTSLASPAPLSRRSSNGMFIMPWPGSPQDEAGAEISSISAGYFHLLRIPLARGRGFTAADIAASPLVAIVSRSLAHRFWGDRNPIGRQIAFDGDTVHPRTVVGEVRDVLPGGPTALGVWAGQVYIPLTQPTHSPPLVASLLVRGGATGAALAAVQPVAGVEVLDSSSLSAAAARVTATQRFSAQVVALFAALALLLIVLALVGLLAHWVTARRHEIAIRLALGATPAAMARSVIVRLALMLAAAVGLTLTASPMLKALLANVLYGIQPLAVGPWAAAVALVCTVALGATAVPALTAAHVAPAEALRFE